MIRTRDVVRKYPQLVDIFLSKDPGYVKSPFIAEKIKISKRSRSLLARYNKLISDQKKYNEVVLLSFNEYEHIAVLPCFYCNRIIKTTDGHGLDKKDPNGRYELKNVLRCCFECNSIKNNFHTVDETKVMVIVRNLFRKKFLLKD